MLTVFTVAAGIEADVACHPDHLSRLSLLAPESETTIMFMRSIEFRSFAGVATIAWLLGCSASDSENTASAPAAAGQGAKATAGEGSASLAGREGQTKPNDAVSGAMLAGSGPTNGGATNANLAGSPAAFGGAPVVSMGGRAANLPTNGGSFVNSPVAGSNPIAGTSPTNGGARVASGGTRATTGGSATTGGAPPATGGTRSPRGGAGGSAARGGAAPTGGRSTQAAGSSNLSGGASGSVGVGGTGGVVPTSLPEGWLYTQGNKVYVSDGSGSGTVWVGRGANVDDIYLCGYNYERWMTSSESEQALTTVVTGLIVDWKATFVRVSLSMNSGYGDVSWLSNPADYKTPMTNVINAIGTHPNVYVMVTLRSDLSMLYGTGVSDPEPTALPSDSTTTPSARDYPTGTDATYIALVDTFANAKHVMFGIANEPGGNSFSNSKISSAMSHAVGVIRAEEDRLGVPHHVIAVQGNSWTSDISFYGSAPLAFDNIVYEVHGYPPTARDYTFNNIPVVIGEYGTLSDSAAFFADLESKQIPSLAWDFEPFSNCAPDLLNITRNASQLTPNSWGTTVQNYLLAHAR